MKINDTKYFNKNILIKIQRRAYSYKHFNWITSFVFYKNHNQWIKWTEKECEKNHS